ncbi:hypothetical protein D3C83_76750 [compost metagenome]
MRFKSRWPSINAAATPIEVRPMPTSNWCAKAPSPAAAVIWVSRSSAQKAALVSPPARIAPTTPGASP